MFLVDGWQTLVSFALAPAILWREKEVQAPGLEIGSIETTTMRNGAPLNWRTMRPKSIFTLTPMEMSVQYDPLSYATITGTFTGVGNAPAGVAGTQTITVTFPDTTTLAFTGWVDKFQPQKNKEGDFALADATIIPGHQDVLGNIVQPRLVQPAAVGVARTVGGGTGGNDLYTFNGVGNTINL